MVEILGIKVVYGDPYPGCNITRQVIEMFKRVVVEDHPDTLVDMDILAFTRRGRDSGYVD